MTEGDELAATRVRRRDGVAMTMLDGEAVLLDEATGTLFHLNASASRVWERLDGDCTVGAVARALAVETGADAGVVWADVVALVDTLADLGLLTAGPAGSRQPSDTSAK